MTHDMAILQDWLNANLLSLNIFKTVLIHYWPRNQQLKVEINRCTIPQVPETKFLGVILDEQLTWDQHALHVQNKMNANKHLLSLTRSFLTSNCLKLIYYSHIYCHLMYGLGAWAVCCPRVI